MVIKIMSNSKRIKEKVHFCVSGLAGAVQSYSTLSLAIVVKFIFPLDTSMKFHSFFHKTKLTPHDRLPYDLPPSEPASSP